MSNKKIYSRTKLGDSVLEDPQGIISGDELLLMALIDGRTSVEGIASKVPPSVRAHLDGIFARLLSAQIIEVTGDAGFGSASENSDLVAAFETSLSMPARQPAGGDAEASRRCTELELELAGVRGKLDAAKARQKEVEAGFHKLKLRVSAYTEVRYARLSKLLRELASYPEHELRAILESELNDALENLQPLNQAMAEQQQVLDKTLSMQSFQGQIHAKQLQSERAADEARMAQAHPHYKKLRGLEFFKGFANAELLQFLEIAKWQEAKAGDTVLNEGDVGMPFFIIVSGAVTVFKGENRLATLDRGDFFGEFAYLSGEEPYRSARVVAETACELLMVDPLDIEFSAVQLRLHVVEALLRGQVRRTLISSKPMDSLPGDDLPNAPDAASP
ncbi:MAG: cyclic nucleotide-binding domain-containing protein [Nitrosomonadales bacterium]|nr:cyclic nucleotide-binding domain-containing protein [Nitrosomonadales bacterium]